MRVSTRSTEIIEEAGPAWLECEVALDAHGTPLPLFHRAIWARAMNATGSRSAFIPIRAADGTCRAGFALEVAASRALPGHRLVLIRRLGIGTGGIDAATLDAGLDAIGARFGSAQSTLRITVEAFALDPESRQMTADALRHHGFTQVPMTQTYERTLLVDLRQSEEKLLAGFHKNTRQGIKNINRFPLILTTAEASSLAPRLQNLSDKTRQRTGGRPRELDWDALIRMSKEAPYLSRIAVLQRTDVNESESLLAFAWGSMQGQVAEYGESGSAGVTDMKVSTTYALLWDLIRWGRRNGAHWFDLGGITSGRTHTEDPLGGISDFKRRFSQREVEVGQQWQLEPHKARAVAARLVSRSVDVLRQGTRWFHRD